MNPNELSQKFHTLADTVVDRVMVMKVASGGLAIIRERTLSGKFPPGSSSGSDQYSTKPFARPYAGITATLKKELRRNAETGVIFTKPNGSTWVVIKGGYKKYREFAGKDVSKVSLTWSGRMLRNLGILNAGETEAMLGFKSDEEKSKKPNGTICSAPENPNGNMCLWNLRRMKSCG